MPTRLAEAGPRSQVSLAEAPCDSTPTAAAPCRPALPVGPSCGSADAGVVSACGSADAGAGSSCGAGGQAPLGGPLSPWLRRGGAPASLMTSDLYRGLRSAKAPETIDKRQPEVRVESKAPVELPEESARELAAARRHARAEAKAAERARRKAASSPAQPEVDARVDAKTPYDSWLMHQARLMAELYRGVNAARPNEASKRARESEATEARSIRSGAGKAEGPDPSRAAEGRKGEGPPMGRPRVSSAREASPSKRP
jgi:hypothetical protein